MVRNFVKRRVVRFFVAAAIAVCAALGLAMLSTGGITAQAAESHSTSHPGWTALTAAGGELTGENYYLTGDTALEADLTVTGTVKLCLNGYVLTGTGTSSVITVDGGTLTLCDCNGTGRTNTVAGVQYAGGVLTGGAGLTSAATNNNASGGGVAVLGGGSLTLESGTIAGNSARVGGGIYAGPQTTLTINGGTVADNSASNGGGVFATNIFQMSGGAITNNTTPQGGYGIGGGVNTNGGTFTMTGGEISDNTAEDGGGVYLGGVLEMSGDAVIQGNSADYAGGGVFVTNGASFVMKGGSVSGNVANYNVGGGVYVNFDASFTMENGTISGNETYYHGGGIYVRDAIISITGGTISGNEAYYSGGGIYAELSTISISDGTISGNSALYSEGGGIFAMGTSLTMTGGTISGNTAMYNGGGVIFIGEREYDSDSEQYYYISSNYTFTVSGDARIENNEVPDGYGGGVCVVYANLTMTGGTVSGNQASYGGGIAAYTYVNISIGGNALIRKNVAHDYGGGIALYENCTLVLAYGTISENTAESSGGGIYSRGESSSRNTVTMTDGTIAKNYAESDGGGIYLTRTDFTMTDGLIEGNEAEASNGGGGVYVAANSSMTMSGGTITGNKITEGLGGGGVSLANETSSVMNISGSPVIAGNTFDGAENNLFIRAGGVVNIVDSLIDARIGVNIYEHSAENRNSVGTFTSGYTTYNGRGDPLTYFSADNLSYTVTLTDAYEAQITYGSYTVVYTMADGTQVPQEYTVGEDVTLQTAEQLGISVTEGSVFGWTTLAGGTSIKYADGAAFTGGLSSVDGTVITLYALQVRDVAGEIDGVIAELDEAVEQVLGTDYTDASSLSDALGALADKIAAAEELIGSLGDGAEGLGAEIDALQTALETAQTTLGGEIDAVQQSLKDAVARLEGLIGDGAADVTALEAVIEEVKTAYAAADALLEADIAALQEQDTALSESITALQSSLEAADDAIWDAIEQLQSDLDETNGKVDGVQSELDEVNGRADALQADLDASEQTLSTVIIVFAVILGVVAVVSVVGLVLALRKGRK